MDPKSALGLKAALGLLLVDQQKAMPSHGTDDWRSHEPKSGSGRPTGKVLSVRWFLYLAITGGFVMAVLGRLSYSGFAPMPDGFEADLNNPHDDDELWLGEYECRAYLRRRLAVFEGADLRWATPRLSATALVYTMRLTMHLSPKPQISTCALPTARRDSQ